MCESQNKNNLKRVPDATVAEEIEEIVLRFDSDWGKTIPDMKDYFVDDSVVQGKLIKDLILVDQEYRWLRKEKITLADYLEKYSLVFRENPGALSLLIIEHFSLAYACKQNTNVDDYLSFTNFLEQEQRTVIFWKLVLIELNHGSSEKIDDYRKHYASIIDSAISPAFSVISKQFENDWIVHPYPKIARYLDYTNSSQRQQLLRELVLLDMTNCWRQGNPRGLEYYIDQFSPLLHADGRIPSELIIREKSLSATVKVSANRIRCAYCQRIQDKDGSDLHCSFCGRAMTNPAFSGITPPVFTGYQIITLLGSGGFGNVYKAWDYTAYRMVALKVPKKQMLPMSHLSRFRREAVTVSHLHHPNIVPLYTYHIDDLPEHSFIAYEYVNGSILTAPIPRTEKEYKNIARMIGGLVDGLHYAHRHRVIHRDIKPQNVFIDAEGKPRLSDFGLARQVRYSEVKNITVEGQLVGTPQYMSPEQMNGLPVDHRSDIYSVGVLLYFLLTGQVPFRSENMAELRHQITEFQVPPPRSLNPSIPDPLEKICLRALQKEPNNRYGKAANIAGDLRHYISGRNVLAKKPGISQAFLQWCWWYPRKATTRISLAIFPILIVLLLGYIQNIVKDKEDFSKNAWEKEFNVWKIYYQSLALQENARGEIAIGIDKDDLRYTQLLDYLRNSRAIKSGDRQELLLNCVRGNFRPVAQYLRGLKDNQGAEFFLGNVYFLIGDQTAAIRLYKKALRSSLGKFTSKGTIYRNIGHCELTLRRPDDALISFRVALSADEQDFEKKSSETAINWIFIGDAYYYLGEYNSSREAFEKAYAIDANYLSDIHPDIARDFDRLGGAWHSLGDYDQSVDFFRRALEIDIQIFTADHPAVARDWWHLGGPLYSLGNYKEAEHCFRNALVIFEKKYGKQDYRVSRAWDLIGGALHGQKRYQDALECFFLALEIDLQLYKDNPLHSNLARDYNHLGGVLLELKKYHEALAYFRQAHRIHRKTIIKKQHPVYARNYERIAKAFLHLKQYNRALLFFEEALSIDIVAYGKNHSVVASDYHHLGILHYQRGESSLARRYLEKALKVLTKNLGKKHQRVTDIKKLMEQLDR